MLVRGGRARVLRPCLENTVIDLSEAPEAAVGDRVLLMGGESEASITLADLAEWQASTPLAVLTGLGRALPHRLISSGAI
jgi:alanine racemase